jgi:hypothetical protein
MTLRTGTVPTLRTSVALLLCTPAVRAQTRWSVDAQASLAWWQVVPNLKHNWATTCPQDPDWRSGEGQAGYWPAPKYPRLPILGDTGEDTVHVPLYPRHKVRWVCAEAIRGEITVADTVHWQGVHGVVAVRGDALITGDQLRDVMIPQFLHTGQFPEILFTVDSFVGVTEQADTIRGSAVGTLAVRDTSIPTTAAVTIFPDTGGMRVLAKWHVPAQALLTLTPDLQRYAFSPKMGKFFFMGADLLFHRGPPDAVTALAYPLIQLRLVRESPAPGFEYMKAVLSSSSAYVQERSLVSDEDIQLARATRRADGLVIDIRMTHEAASRLREAIREYVGGRIGVLLAGRLVGTPQIVGAPPRGEGTTVTSQDVLQVGVDLPQEDADQIVAAVAARWR